LKLLYYISSYLYSSLTSAGDNDQFAGNLPGRHLELKWSMPLHLVDDDPVQLTAGEVITCGAPADFVTWGPRPMQASRPMM
jgi:hypothetical protein